ncbi:hypothetical protein PROCOU_06583 [Listeria rocourtiae FSL F6-920]|nr:hypothetical protein PROCOU_06583 [Listeria rocourtiae FSL F6-920]
MTDFEKGQAVFTRFLEDRGIPKRPTMNKILRFYEAVYKEK